MNFTFMSVLALVCLVLTPKKSANIVKSQNLVEFHISNAGMEVNGVVGSISTDIQFDPADLEHSYMLAAADAATLQTGIAIRDKHLQRSDYFDVKNHPLIEIASKSFRKTGKNTFTGSFHLTIKGITKEVHIPFTVLDKQKDTIYKGSFEINRLDFNVGEKSVILDEQVKIFIEVHASDSSRF
jgi:polyisoprenoid-binding protein YceI